VRPLLIVVLIGSLLSGCASVVSSAAGGVADSLSGAIMNSRDPETVASALPAYLLLIDGLVADAPDDPELLRAAATLHGSFAANFVDEPQRAGHMHDRALELALRSWCAEDRMPAICGAWTTTTSRPWSARRTTRMPSTCSAAAGPG